MEQGAKEDRGLHRIALRIFIGLAPSYELALGVGTLLQDRTWKRWVVGRTAPSSGELVVDVGCGTLVLSERLAGSGCEVVGVDLTKEMLDLCRQKRLRNTPLLVRADAENLPFRDSAFDVAISCYVPKYVDSEKFGREMARATRPGGRVAAYDFARPSGAFAPFILLYFALFLRSAGALLRLWKRREAATFTLLPGIVEEEEWVGPFEAALGDARVSIEDSARLTGGVVHAVYGVKETAFRG